MSNHAPSTPQASGTSAQGCIVADDVRSDVSSWHVAEKLQCQLPLSTLLAGADGSTVADNIRVDFKIGHKSEQVRGQLPMPSFLTCADGSIACDDILGSSHYGA